MTQTVLVPIDGSPRSFDALRHALTEFPDATIIVHHVVDLFAPAESDPGDAEPTYEPLLGSEAWYDWVDRFTERLLDRARDLAAEYDRDIETVSDIGDPKRIIVDYADEEAVDHIVVGTHGRSSTETSPLGSVATVVARRAPVPVTLVR